MFTASILSIGYEGRSQSDFIGLLKAHKVNALVDVRMTPLSRKAGLSKTAISVALGSVGIGYHHLRTLGNPKDNRELFRSGSPEGRQNFVKFMLEHGKAELQFLIGLIAKQSVAVMCFEREHECCHRSCIIEEVVRQTPLKVTCV